MNETDGLTPEWFKPAGEDESNPREFKVRGLNGLEALDITTETSFEEGQLKITGRGLRQAVKLGLLDWRINGVNGEDIEFDRSKISEIEALTLHKIGMRIINKTNMSSSQLGNSESQSK